MPDGPREPSRLPSMRLNLNRGNVLPRVLEDTVINAYRMKFSPRPSEHNYIEQSAHTNVKSNSISNIIIPGDDMDASDIEFQENMLNHSPNGSGNPSGFTGFLLNPSTTHFNDQQHEQSPTVQNSSKGTEDLQRPLQSFDGIIFNKKNIVSRQDDIAMSPISSPMEGDGPDDFTGEVGEDLTSEKGLTNEDNILNSLSLVPSLSMIMDNELLDEEGVLKTDNSLMNYYNTNDPGKLRTCLERSLCFTMNFVTPFLAISSAEVANDVEFLEFIGITHHINLAPDIVNPFENYYNVCSNPHPYAGSGLSDTPEIRRDSRAKAHKVRNKIKKRVYFVQDNVSAQIECILYDSFAVIEEARKEGGKCLVSCHKGISRSAAIVISYLMNAKNITIEEAMRMLRRRRPIVNPNLGFIIQIRRWDLRRKETKYGKAAAATNPLVTQWDESETDKMNAKVLEYLESSNGCGRYNQSIEDLKKINNFENNEELCGSIVTTEQIDIRYGNFLKNNFDNSTSVQRVVSWSKIDPSLMVGKFVTSSKIRIMDYLDPRFIFFIRTPNCLFVFEGRVFPSAHGSKFTTKIKKSALKIITQTNRFELGNLEPIFISESWVTQAVVRVRKAVSFVSEYMSGEPESAVIESRSNCRRKSVFDQSTLCGAQNSSGNKGRFSGHCEPPLSHNARKPGIPYSIKLDASNNGRGTTLLRYAKSQSSLGIMHHPEGHSSLGYCSQMSREDPKTVREPNKLVFSSTGESFSESISTESTDFESSHSPKEISGIARENMKSFFMKFSKYVEWKLNGKSSNKSSPKIFYEPARVQSFLQGRVYENPGTKIIVTNSPKLTIGQDNEMSLAASIGRGVFRNCQNENTTKGDENNKQAEFPQTEDAYTYSKTGNTQGTYNSARQLYFNQEHNGREIRVVRPQPFGVAFDRIDEGRACITPEPENRMNVNFKTISAFSRMMDSQNGNHSSGDSSRINTFNNHSPHTRNAGPVQHSPIPHSNSSPNLDSSSLEVVNDPSSTDIVSSDLSSTFDESLTENRFVTRSSPGDTHGRVSRFSPTKGIKAHPSEPYDQKGKILTSIPEDGRASSCDEELRTITVHEMSQTSSFSEIVPASSSSFNPTGRCDFESSIDWRSGRPQDTFFNKTVRRKLEFSVKVILITAYFLSQIGEIDEFTLDDFNSSISRLSECDVFDFVVGDAGIYGDFLVMANLVADKITTKLVPKYDEDSKLLEMVGRHFETDEEKKANDYIDGIPKENFSNPSFYTSVKVKTLLKRVKLKSAYISSFLNTAPKSSDTRPSLRKSIKAEEAKRNHTPLINETIVDTKLESERSSMKEEGEPTPNPSPTLLQNNSVKGDTQHLSTSCCCKDIPLEPQGGEVLEGEKSLITNTLAISNCNSNTVSAVSTDRIKSSKDNDLENNRQPPTQNCQQLSGNKTRESGGSRESSGKDIGQEIKNIIKNNFEQFRQCQSSRKPEFYIYLQETGEFKRFTDPEDTDVLESDTSLLVDHRGKNIYVYMSKRHEDEGGTVVVSPSDVVSAFEFSEYICKGYTVVPITKNCFGDIDNDEFWDLFDFC